MSAKSRAVLVACLVALLAIGTAAQNRPAAGSTAKPGAASDTTDRAKVIRAAADALGMIRWSDIGAGATRLPGIDVVNTMEFVAAGADSSSGQPVQTEYHVAIGYNPAAMRTEMTRTGAGPQHSIQTVRENYAWDESELGAGLVAGKGTATPQASAVKDRNLRLWTLPYGVVKAAVAAGDKASVSTEGGNTILTFPLTGPLAGVTVKATLDAKNFITKVETRQDNAAQTNLATETEYSDYADHGEILTDIKSPGHIVRKQGGRTVMDIRVKNWESNNPYLVFPVPANVKTASASAGSDSGSATARR
jgi:hypothetical protein